MAVSDQIIKVLDALCEKFGIVIDWTSDNVIPYMTTLCTKLVTWEIWSSVAWIGIMTVLSIIAVIIAARFRTFSYETLNDWDLPGYLLDTVFLVIWIAAVACIGTQIFDIIKCTTFPEMFVFEYIQNLINSAK